MEYKDELEKIAAGEAANPQQPYRSLIPFILTQEELSMQDIPPREYLLSEWMPKDSFGMVYAPRGVGKSWFCFLYERRRFKASAWSDKASIIAT